MTTFFEIAVDKIDTAMKCMWFPNFIWFFAADIDECASRNNSNIGNNNSNISNSTSNSTGYNNSTNNSHNTSTIAHNCSQVCINTAGSYTCGCYPGYRINANNTSQCDGRFGHVCVCVCTYVRINVSMFLYIYNICWVWYSAAAQAIGHVVSSRSGSLCRGWGDSPQHRH